MLEQQGLPCSDLTAHIDHANLVHIKKTSDSLLRSWMMELTLRHIAVAHLPGSEMRPQDQLSRLPVNDDTTPPSTTAAIASILVAPTIHATTTIRVAPILINSTSNLLKFTETQALFTPAERDAMTAKPASFHLATIPTSIDATVTVWLHNNAVVIPSACSDLISKYIADAHADSCHSRESTMHAILSHVWWQSKAKDILQYINSCPECQLVHAPPRHAPLGFFNIKNPSHSHYQHLLDHLIINPPSSAGHVAILTLTCAFTRFLYLVPVLSLSAADTLAAALSVWHDSGLPNVVQTDGSTSFMGDFHAYLDMVRTNHAVTDAYSAWQLAKSERQHHTIAQHMRKLTLGKDQTEWHNTLPLIAGTLNAAHCRTLGTSPYCALYGREKRTPAVAKSDLFTPTGTLAAWHTLINTIQAVISMKNDITSIQQSHMQMQVSSPPPVYTLAQDVLLFFPDRPAKLDTFWRPGYRITDLIPDDDTHCIVSRVEPDGSLNDPQRVPIARLRAWDTSRTTNAGAALRIADASLAVAAILSHETWTTDTNPPAPRHYTFTVRWEDTSLPPSPARLQDLMLNCPHLLKPYCALNFIPYSRLVTLRTHLNKMEKAPPVISQSVARISLAAIFGTDPFHPVKPTHTWL